MPFLTGGVVVDAIWRHLLSRAFDAVTSIDIYVSGSTVYPFDAETIPLRV